MNLDFYTEVYSYDLFLNLEVLKKYHIDAELMHRWNKKSGITNLKRAHYKVTFYLNNIKQIDADLRDIISNTKFSNVQLQNDDERQKELANSLMYLCNETEKDLRSTLFNDEDYQELLKLSNKINKILSKEISDLTVNRIALEDVTIAKDIQSLTIDSLSNKFIRLAKSTRYNYICTLDQVLSFEKEFKEANETTHLEILGYWADIIQAYLHNEEFMLSIDNTKLNKNRKTDFPLTNEQSNLIYQLFDLFNLKTKRKKEAYTSNFYVRNCIKKYTKTLSSIPNVDLE